MPQPNEKTTATNLNVTALRVLSVLRHLIHLGPMHTGQLNACLANDANIRRGFGTETLTKYVNTLRHLGCAIPRATPGNQFQYQLTLSPFSWALSTEEAHLLSKSISHALASSQCSATSVNAWQKVLWSVSCPSSQALRDIKLLLNTLDTQPPPPSLSKPTGASLWHQYCQQGQAVLVQLTATATESETLTLDPTHVICQPWGEFYVGVDRNTGQERLLHPNHITSIKQLPARVLGRTQTRRLQFRLFGKLARSYRLYPGETELPPQMDTPADAIDILSTQCELPIVLHRLLKYGSQCQVISPEFAAQAVKQHLTQQLKAMNSSYSLPASI